MRLEEHVRLKESLGVDLARVLIEGQSDQLVISTLQKVFGIFVSQLDELELSHDLRVDDSELVVDSLIEDQMVNVLVHRISDLSQSANTI